MHLLNFILSEIDTDELGNIPLTAFEHTVRHLFKMIVVVGDKESISENYTNYRCFNAFKLTEEYSFYEYSRWIGSCLDLAKNIGHLNHIVINQFLRKLSCKDTGHSRSGLNLICTPEMSLDTIIDIMHLTLPTLKYTIVLNGDIEIKLDDLNQFLLSY